MMMDEYHLKDVTAEAKDIAQSDGYQRDLQANTQFGAIPSRVPLNASFSKKGKDDRMKAKGLHTVMYRKDAIDISGLEQLVDDSQTNALTVMMNYFRHHLIDNHKSLIEATNQMYDLIDEEGIEADI